MKKSKKEPKRSTSTSHSSSPLTIAKELLTVDICNSGFDQEDRTGRDVKALPGHFMVFKDPELVDYIKKQKPEDKFKADWKRMYKTFTQAAKTAKEGINSRQLMVMNGTNFYRDLPCFTHMQFVMTHRNEFDMYVYQRSADVEKFIPDMIFFGSMMKKFGDKTGISVTKLVVIYGNCHYEV